MPEAVFIDTWGWLALGHRHDARSYIQMHMYISLTELVAGIKGISPFHSHL